MIEDCVPKYHQSERVVVYDVHLPNLLCASKETCIGMCPQIPSISRRVVSCAFYPPARSAQPSLSPSISQSNSSKKVAHNWHLASTTTISASNALYGTWDQIVSSEEKGRWSNGDWNFCDIEILERANSSPHLAGSDPIDQGTIVTSPLSPLSPHVSPPKSSDLCCY